MILPEKCSSCYILLINQILLYDCFYFLRYGPLCVFVIRFPVCQDINFEIDLVFLNKIFSKQTVIIFKGLSVAKNCLRLESAPLILT